MKQNFLLLISAVLIAACSSPKYTYHFDTYDYNSGKKKATAEEARVAVQLPAPETSPLMLAPEAVSANASGQIQPVVSAPSIAAEDKAILDTKLREIAREYKAMSKSEKRAFRKELKKEVKAAVKAKKSEEVRSIDEAKQMDYDLKMALIFGIVGIVLSALGGVNSVFWILGVVSIVVALVFLIKWIAEQ